MGLQAPFEQVAIKCIWIYVPQAGKQQTNSNNGYIAQFL
jgi:hypothetical protein